MASKQQIDDLKKILLMREQSIMSNIQDSTDNIIKLKNMDCKDEYDFAEASSDSFTSEIIATRQAKELTEIQNALQMINDDKYGICQMCDDNIEIGRLRAKPFAKYCTPCREIFENNNK